MKQILLLFVASLCICALKAQDSKAKKITAFAITAPQKGQSSWTEVRLVDIVTGEEVQSIYQSSGKPEILNARTGKPVVKKDLAVAETVAAKRQAENLSVNNLVASKKELEKNAVVEARVQVQTTTYTTTQKDANGNVRTIVIRERLPVKTSTDQPFATNSAACAYDRKHERLYYTPMNFAQLRYIDLKSNKIYYFEDEAFGVVKGRGDVQNQITRMVFASDGNGYALTNDARHLVQFTTGKKPAITDLGEITDDAANGAKSVHNSDGYGGDMIADAQKNLYLITANRNVFKISLETRVATYLGAIKGLPRGFSTNGAFVEESSKVIVCSSTSTQGYYRFDLNTLESEKVSTQASVFNASDLANGALAFEKTKKEKKERKHPQFVPAIVEEDQAVVNNAVAEQKTKPQTEAIAGGSISVYPNPVLNGVVRLSFADQPAGKYQVQFMDVAGKTISVQEVTINNKMQVEEFRLPYNIAKGNYLVKVSSASNGVSVSNKLVVQ